MSNENLDYLPDLTAPQMQSARHLTFTSYPTTVNWDNLASAYGSDDYALLHSIYNFNAVAGATYDIFSLSYFDPFLLRLYDGQGNTIVANDEGDDGTYVNLSDGGFYSQDVLWDWVAPYSGTYYVDASWNQGSYFDFYSISVYEDVDTVPVTTVVPEPPVSPEQVQPADLDVWEYLASNSDLITAFGTNIDAVAKHYIEYGYNERRTTNFDEWGYLAANKDLMNAFGEDTDAAVRHYVVYGHSEGRSTYFNALDYLAANKDLQIAFGTDTEAAKRHYVEYGHDEGRIVHLAGVPIETAETVQIC